MDKAEGDKVELEKVLLVADDKNVTVGTPTVEGAKVLATSKGMAKVKRSSSSNSSTKPAIPKEADTARSIPG
jgi:ribosomal protein L21